MHRRAPKLFVGIGHVLKRDDGVGVRAAEVMARRPLPDDVEVYEAGLAGWSLALRRQGGPVAIVGDFNVAPLETDVWSHKQLLNVVSHTPVEVDKLNRAQAAGEWVDAVRRFIPPDERLYSWWSYRARDWAASDRGRLPASVS